MFFGCGSPQTRHIKQRYIDADDSILIMMNDIMKQKYIINEKICLDLLDSINFSDEEYELMNDNYENMQKKVLQLYESEKVLLKMIRNSDYPDLNWAKLLGIERKIHREQIDYSKKMFKTSNPINDTTFTSVLADQYCLFRDTYAEHLKSMNKIIEIRHRLIIKMKFKSDLMALTGAEIISKDLPHKKH